MLLSWAVVVAAATAVCAASPRLLLPLKLKDEKGTAGQHSLPDFNAFHAMFMALSDMQGAYFERWVGTWPHGIDWTRAVMSTHVAAALRTISSELERSQPDRGPECATRKQEVIAGYFADIIAYYFAEDAFAIRNQAYDDMLWVVLGWLESIQFVDEHSRFHSRVAPSGLGSRPGAETWYGSRWIPAFAHRARIFWELAAKGWDTTLCGGGMVWNPRLMPYKNAITNELFISASINMYLNFPGDPNTSPFGSGSDSNPVQSHWNSDWRPHDPVFARAAQEAHKWLTSSNMTNAQGLYADGFHISGLGSGSNNTKCDERDEMVYTYNQGVILSGLLGLFQATGREHYLREGHTLIQNVIRATGYNLTRNAPIDDIVPHRLPPWRGLGRVGILEDACDVTGTCSQDAQTFKGIWMHHFAAFCSPTALQRQSIHPDAKLDDPVLTAIRLRHASACRRYIPWLRRNARGAMGTRDARGLFGMWWTAGLLRFASSEDLEPTGDVLPPEGKGVVDYRNRGVPMDEVWMRVGDLPSPPVTGDGAAGQKPMGSGLGRGNRSVAASHQHRDRVDKRGVDSRDSSGAWDPNLRGRGRTVETQGGGLAVLRALWVVSRHEL